MSFKLGEAKDFWPWKQDHKDSLDRKVWTYYPGGELNELYEGFFGHVYEKGKGVYRWDVGEAFPGGRKYKSGSAWTVLGAQLSAANAFRKMINGR